MPLDEDIPPPESLLQDYRAMHQADPCYGNACPHAFDIIRFLQAHHPPIRSVLDWGCGKGNLCHRLTIAGFHARGYDPAVPPFDSPSALVPADALVSTDVLEHLHPLTAAAELAAVIRAVRPTLSYYVISTRPAAARLPSTGRQCHTIVQPHAWWVDWLSAVYTAADHPPVYLSGTHLPHTQETLIAITPHTP